MKMNTQIKKCEDLLIKVKFSLERIYSETSISKHRKLRKSINKTIEIIKQDFKTIEEYKQKIKIKEKKEENSTGQINNESETEEQSNGSSKIEEEQNNVITNEISTENQINSKNEENKNLENLMSINGEKYWEPYKYACQATNPIKIREMALDALQYLISHRLLNGSTLIEENNQSTLSSPSSKLSKSKENGSQDTATSTISEASNSAASSNVENNQDNNEHGQEHESTSNKSKTTHVQYPSPAFLIDEIIHIICSSFSINAAEDSIQLQVLKVLLTSVTSTSCEIHHVTLLKAIQTCFNIYIFSKNPNNQITAKAVLTQMVNLIFSRMERYSYVLSKHIENGTLLKLSKTIPLREVVEQLSDMSNQEKYMNTNGNENNDEKKQATLTTTTATATTTTTTSSLSLHEDEAIQNNKESSTPITISLTTSSSEQQDNTTNTENINVNEQQNNLDSKNENAPVDTTTTPTDKESKNASPKNSLKIDILKISTNTSSSNISATIDRNPYDPTIAYYNELLRKDVFLVFRLLCQMSLFKDNGQMFMLNNNNSTVSNSQPASASTELSPTLTKARILALELIFSILNNSGPVFQTDPLYTDMIKNYLCISISRNGLSENPVIVELSLSIFIMMLRFYKAQLKAEIEVILNTIYLHILEMGSSSFIQKKKLLEGLQKVCENPQTLVDIYLNYDCDMNLESVFEKIINSCARVAQGRGLKSNSQYKSSSQNDTTFMQERELRVYGIRCLVSIINSMVEWNKEMQPLNELGNESYIHSTDGEENDLENSEPAVSFPSSPNQSQIPKDKIYASAAASSNGSSTTSLTNINSKQDSLINESVKNQFTKKNKEYLQKNNSSSTINNSASFRDALLPQNQIHNVLIYKNPLGSVSLNDIPVQSSITTSQNSMESNSTKIEEVLSKKHAYTKGINLFNIKPKKGIEFLVKENFLEKNIDDISKFLHETPGLNKAAIGEYLGEGDPFNILLMHKFVDLMDFHDMAFVDAIRHFLQAFRLPGESQKIDRLMEKFADRYCENNPNVFANADTAYTLAFSVIMLNTDQHSSQIKNRMEKQDFIKNNRGINDNADLPNEFLSQIFDEISKNEIVMEEEQASKIAKIAKGQLMSEQERRQLYYKEMEKMQKLSQELIKHGGSKKNRKIDTYKSATQAEIIKPMFIVSWCPLMATLSLIFEDINYTPIENENDNKKMIEENNYLAELCLSGITSAIRIASIFNMTIERNAFISTLTKMTGLFNIQNITPKNIKAIEDLIQLATTYGEYFDDNWYDFLICLSQLERIQYLYDQQNNNMTITSATPTATPTSTTATSPNTSKMDNTGANNKMGSHNNYNNNNKNSNNTINTNQYVNELVISKTPYLDILVEKIQSQSMIILIDKIFTNTMLLSGTEIIHFCKCLCEVSLEEVQLNKKSSRISASIVTAMPRMYSLQKIVEITYYNMGRIRLEFVKIWNIIQNHFNMVGCHSNLNVATFAIDSLRQLTMKFLERDELTHYQTQNEFLKCFDSIMRKTESPIIKDMIIQSMSQIISLQAKSIRSGWKGIFSVLARTAQNNTNIKIMEKAFNLVQFIFQNYLDMIISSGSYVSYIACLKDFILIDQITSIGDKITMNTFTLLQDCVNQLAEANAIKLKMEKGELQSFGNNSDINNNSHETNDISNNNNIKDDNNKNNNNNIKDDNNKNNNNNINVDSNDSSKNGNNNNAENNNINDNNDNDSNSNISSIGIEITTKKNSIDSDQNQNRGSSNDNSNNNVIENLSNSIKLLLQISSEDQYYLMWFPILSTYSQIIIRSNNSNVKTRALTCLFDALENIASTLLDTMFWKNIQRSVIFPIFEDMMEHDENETTANDLFDSEMMVVSVEMESPSSDNSQGIKNTNNVSYSSAALWTNAFLRLLDLFKNHFTTLSHHLDLVSGFLDLVVSLIQKPRDELSNMGITFLQQFLDENLEKIKGNEIWEIVTSAVEKCFSVTSPSESFENISGGGGDGSSIKMRSTRENKKKNMEQMTSRYIIHLRLIQEIQKFCNIGISNTLIDDKPEYFVNENYRNLILNRFKDDTDNNENNNINHINDNNDNNDNNNDNGNDNDNNNDINNNVNNNKSQENQSKDIPVIASIPMQYQMRWINLFYTTYQTIHAINENRSMNQSIHQQNVTEHLPILIEIISFSSYLQLLFSLYSVYGDSRVNSKEILENRIIPMCMMILKCYVKFTETGSKYQSKILSIIIMLYQELLKIKGWQHVKGSNKINYKSISQLNIHDAPPIINTKDNTISEEIEDENQNENENENENEATENKNKINGIEIKSPELWDGLRKEIPKFFKYSIPLIRSINNDKTMLVNNANYTMQLNDLTNVLVEFYSIVADNFFNHID